MNTEDRKQPVNYQHVNNLINNVIQTLQKASPDAHITQAIQQLRELNEEMTRKAA